MALEVIQLENQLMRSNCFILVDWNSKSCAIIDPGSEKSEREINYIEGNKLRLDYILLTHEHTDHTWGANALKENYPKAKLVCSELCNKYAKKASRAYFLFYYDDPNYRYELLPADILIYQDGEILYWNGRVFKFLFTPGHSRGSMCIQIDEMLFTGDTIMPYPPYFNGRDSNQDDWGNSIRKIDCIFSEDIIVYPGHGGSLSLENWKVKYLNRC